MAVMGEFNYLCRLCATKTGILMGLPIFEPEDQIRNIDRKITACLPVQISMSDQLPKVVCEQCAFKLDEMFDFREKVLHTEKLFIHMLKSIKNESLCLENNITHIKTVHSDINNIQNGVDNIENSNCPVNSETMRVMDDGEQNITQEKLTSPGNTNTEVQGIECLNVSVNAVGIVNDHMNHVTGDEIAIHLEEENITVVGNLSVDNHLDINYVTAIDTQSQDEEIVQFCDNVKYETIRVGVENEYHCLRERLTVGNATHNIDNTNKFSQSNHENFDDNNIHEEISENSESLNKNSIQPINDNVSKNSDIVVEYTKTAKHALLANILNNPTIDETNSNWYVCSFCNEAATDPNNLIDHFEQHFCACSCGLFFTSIEELNFHEQQCNGEVKDEKNSDDLIDNGVQVNSNSIVNLSDGDDDNNKKSQSNSRQKWSPKICNHCGKHYRTNYKLQEHMRKHTGEKPFQCSLCEKAFRSKIGLAQHTAAHTGKFDYSCSTCGKGFQCKSYLIVHQRVHSDLKPYPCDTCGQNFKTKQSLLDHQNRHLGVKPYVCDICGRGFITKGLCKSHQKIHSGTDNRQYPCNVCNKMFVSKSYLNTHLRIHTGEKPYLCDACGKGFLTLVDLKIHSTVHTGEKSFKCEICPKLFARRAALRCHRRSHTGERPYVCDVCGKTFTQFSPMAIHKRLHTGERPYECDICAKTFVSRSTMMCHKKKHQLNNSVNNTKDFDDIIKDDENVIETEEQSKFPTSNSKGISENKIANAK